MYAASGIGHRRLANLFLCIDDLDVAVMPLGPGHALLMARRGLSAERLRGFFLTLARRPGELTLGTFAAYDVLLLPGAGMDDARRHHAFISRWRGKLRPVKAKIDDYRQRILALKQLGRL